jgi:hypothetical protein
LHSAKIEFSTMNLIEFMFFYKLEDNIAVV